MSTKGNRDIISITHLSLRSPLLREDLWQKPNKSQPLFVSLSISTDVEDEASSDSLLEGESLNYGIVTKTIEKVIQELDSSSIISLEELADVLAAAIIFKANAPNVSLQLSRPRALLSAASIAVHITRDRSDYTTPIVDGVTSSPQLVPHSRNSGNDKFVIRELRRSIVIGVNDCERIDEQEVIVDIEFGVHAAMNHVGGIRQGWQGWRGVVKALESHLSIARPLTIEAITTSLSQIILAPPSSPSRFSLYPSVDWDVPSTTVRIAKPCALMYAKYPAVQISRSRSDFFLPNGTSRSSSTAAASSLSASMMSSASFGTTVSTADSGSTAGTEAMLAGTSAVHSVVLGIGSNMGERMANIGRALKEIERISVIDGGEQGGEKTRVVDTSFLYESEAMYIVDQAKFLNAVIQIETTLSPTALLSFLKTIESNLGRQKTVQNGPRVIDLDILFYDDLIYDSRIDGRPMDNRWLKIPHSSILEREFVLRPLADLSDPPLHPAHDNASPSQLLSLCLAQAPTSLHRVIPLSASLTHPVGSRTLTMSIINATPDSFSDGGDNATLDAALKTALQHIEAGVDIVDIGGMSTRPGADDVDQQIEIERVFPLIRAIRARNSSIPISIDTFRPAVAEAAVQAGATIINDVMGGSTEGMLATMARLDVPVVLMHSRGTPATMSGMTTYPQGVVEGVRAELEERIERAMRAGVRRWNIIVDPGIGFAKTGDDNLLLLRRLPELLVKGVSAATSKAAPARRLPFSPSATLATFPSLVGLSRKKFLGTLTGKDKAKDRVMATAAGVTSSIAGGADIVRVHDLLEMKDVVRVADGIYR